MMMNVEEITAFVERRLEQQKEEQKKEFDAKLAKLEEKLNEQEEKLNEQEEKLNEQAVVLDNMTDPRLKVWNAGESSSTKSTKSTNSTDKNRNISNRKEYKKTIGMCMGCGCTDQSKLSVAHIVAHNSAINTDGNYVDDVEIECTRNYLVLCGNHGEENTCHNSYDNLKMSLYFSKADGVFKWYTADDVTAERVRDRVLSVDEIGEKYVRLLNWRTLKTVIGHGTPYRGSSADRAQFINFLKISEEDECND
jgi:DNA-binding transcriptional MerR regulator